MHPLLVRALVLASVAAMLYIAFARSSATSARVDPSTAATFSLRTFKISQHFDWTSFPPYRDPAAVADNVPTSLVQFAVHTGQDVVEFFNVTCTLDAHGDKKNSTVTQRPAWPGRCQTTCASNNAKACCLCTHWKIEAGGGDQPDAAEIRLASNVVSHLLLGDPQALLDLYKPVTLSANASDFVQPQVNGGSGVGVEFLCKGKRLVWLGGGGGGGVDVRSRGGGSGAGLQAQKWALGGGSGGGVEWQMRQGQIQAASWSFGWAVDSTRNMKRPTVKDVKDTREDLLRCYRAGGLQVKGGGGSGSAAGQSWVRFASAF